MDRIYGVHGKDVKYMQRFGWNICKKEIHGNTLLDILKLMLKT
jgi:hypothetical protein